MYSVLSFSDLFFSAIVTFVEASSNIVSIGGAHFLAQGPQAPASNQQEHKPLTTSVSLFLLYFGNITMTKIFFFTLSLSLWCSMSALCCKKPGLPGERDTSGIECLLITQPTLTTCYWPR